MTINTRNLLTTVLLAVCATVAMGQDESNGTTFDIKGSCPTDVSMVYVADITNMKAPLDSVETKNGQFRMKGSAAKEAFLALTAKGKKGWAVFINDGTPVNADMGIMAINGSPLNNKFQACVKQMAELEDQMTPYVQKYNEAVNSGKSREEIEKLVKEEIEKYIAPIQEQSGTLAKKFVKENTDNVIPAYFIGRIIYDCEFEELKQLLKPEYAYTNHPLARQAKAYLDDLTKKMAVIGTQFKDIEMKGTDGNNHKLSDYCGKGNYVLIDFWASWCGPCRAEMPNVKANYEKYHSKGFEIVGLSFDNNDAAWKKAIDDMGMAWVNLSDLQGWKSLAAQTYSIRSIPSSLLVDPEGKVVDIDLRGEKLGDKLKAIYGF